MANVWDLLLGSAWPANVVMASPNGSAGPLTPRSLVFADLPAIPTGTVLWNQIGNASGALTLANAGFSSTFNQTSAVTWLHANTTSAVHLTSQSSPILQLAGTVYNGSTSVADTWSIQDVVGNTDNGTSTLTFTQSGSTGVPQLQIPGMLSIATAAASYITTAQTATDTFTRANENPLGNGTWAVSGGSANTGKIVSNLFECQTVNSSSVPLWSANGAGFDSADQYSEITLAAVATANASASAVVRGSTAAFTHYRLTITGPLNSSATWTLFKIVAGAATTLAGPTTRTFAAADTVRLAVLGTSLYGFHNGTMIVTATDAAIATGKPGILTFELTGGALTDSQVSLWTGGTVVATATPNSAGNITLQNPSVALAVTSFSSPSQTFSGQYWTGAASAEDKWVAQNILAAGTNGTSTLTFTHTGTSGTAGLKLVNGAGSLTLNPVLISGTGLGGLTVQGPQGMTLNGSGSAAIALASSVKLSAGTTVDFVPLSLANGQLWSHGATTELITLSTVGTTTDSTGNLLPANSVIEAVIARVTTTITTATDWKLGDATTAARFSNANSTLTSGTTQIGVNCWNGSVATDAAGPTQTAAAKLRITTTGTPGAGVIRVTVYFRTYTPPTS